MKINLRKQDIIVFTLAGILVLIVIGIAIFSFQPRPKQEALPTPTSKPLPTTPPTPTLPEVLEKYPVEYDNDASKAFWRKAEKKPPLSPQDTEAKNTLISENLTEEGVVYRSENVRIDYVRSADIFQAEVFITDFTKGKREAITWLQSYGLSQEGICNLPIMFSMDLFTAQSLKHQNITLNPLPDGCE